ncbi:MAG: hypothetical protein M1829_006068 [Trizodia sp. TS-e1964]|nr:MAG: hypothetical protein M1829_006068 [Trizodia sp. TS-e1964]
MAFGGKPSRRGQGESKIAKNQGWSDGATKSKRDSVEVEGSRSIANAQAKASAKPNSPPSIHPAPARIRPPPNTSEALQAAPCDEAATPNEKMNPDSSRSDAESSTEDLPRLKSPPVTAASLEELNITRIVHNLKLRNDINYDPDLHFRPNLDGENGANKVQQGSNYWADLTSEILFYSLPAESPERDTWDKVDRLDLAFASIREILQTLVPTRDHPALIESLNEKWLVSQLKRGNYNFVGLSQWLARLIKSHCAPMRDDWVDQMVAQVQIGTEQANINELVNGLKELFGILEAMKLDVANHQIRSLRHLLIEDTVHFQQKHFKRKISSGTLNVEECLRWFRQSYSDEQQETYTSSDPNLGALQQFFKAMVHSLRTSAGTKSIPDTFSLDNDRILKLRSDVQELIFLEISVDVFKFVSESVSFCNEDIESLKDSITIVVGEGDGDYRSVESLDNVAQKIIDKAYPEKQYPKSFRQVIFRRTQAHLRKSFDKTSNSHSRIEKEVIESIRARVLEHASVYMNLTPWKIFENVYLHKASWASTISDPVEKIAQRIIHLGTLHWRIWKDLVYLRKEEESSTTVANTALPDTIVTCDRSRGTLAGMPMTEI